MGALEALEGAVAAPRPRDQPAPPPLREDLGRMFRFGRGTRGLSFYDRGREQLEALNQQLPYEITSANFNATMGIMLQRMDLFLTDAECEIAAEMGSQVWEYKQYEKWQEQKREMEEIARNRDSYAFPCPVPVEILGQGRQVPT